jgi:predicted kinase
VRLQEILQSGQNDVVVDLSFAFRASRDEYRTIVEAGGAHVVIVYLKTDISELRRRIKERTAAGLDADSAFKMTTEIFDRYASGFEEPVGEGELVMQR